MTTETKRSPVSGMDVWHSEEFKALCKRFGIFWEARTTAITIRLGLEEMLQVTHEYYGTVKEPDTDEAIETTNMHNEDYRTYTPRQNREY